MYSIEIRNINRGISRINPFGLARSAGLQPRQPLLRVIHFRQARVGFLPEVEEHYKQKLARGIQKDNLEASISVALRLMRPV